MIGAPPSERDPFDVVQMPDSAERAAKSGVIGEGESESSRVETEQESLEKLADRTNEPGASDESFPEAGEGEHRCFSCVKLCPDSKPGDCDPSSEDVVCGWGVHPERETARRAARAECGGALDLMRSSDRWSEISGGCPEATCQQ